MTLREPEPIHFARSIMGVGRVDELDRIMVVEERSQPSPWARAVFEKEFGLEYSSVWVWRQPDVGVVAFLVFWVILDEVHVLNVVTDPDARRQGLAQRLVIELIKAAQGARMTMITLEVRESNQAARQLYGGLGFRQIGRRPRYYANNQEAALVMARILEEC